MSSHFARRLARHALILGYADALQRIDQGLVTPKQMLDPVTVAGEGRGASVGLGCVDEVRFSQSFGDENQFLDLVSHYLLRICLITKTVPVIHFGQTRLPAVPLKQAQHG